MRPADRLSSEPGGSEAVLDLWTRKNLLRFLTCGSVDDGKSTLIGRLLYESDSLYEDQLAALAEDSRRGSLTATDLDFAMVVDGLADEREQQITIDVAYRFFSTARRRFIIADTPGHEQYTRNMITGASTTDLAVILVDARKGLLPQTRRHSCLVSLLGVREVVLAVNKMDLVDYSRDVFLGIEQRFRSFAARLGPMNIKAIPVVAVDGDNIVRSSPRMPWYEGPALLQHLDTVEVAQNDQSRPFRMPVQCAIRPDATFRGFAGLVASGQIEVGSPVVVLPCGQKTRVTALLVGSTELEWVAAGRSVTMTLADDIDVSRGDVIAGVDAPPSVANQFEATIVWLHEQPLLPGRSYLGRFGTQTTAVTVTALNGRLDLDSLAPVAATTLEMNDLGVCTLDSAQPIPFEPYAACPALGGFLLIDRITNGTVAAGMLNAGTYRSRDVRWYDHDIDKDARAALKHHRPCIVWFTGLSGAGKSTIANVVEQRLYESGRHTFLLDGDNVRHGLNYDLGFSSADRIENVRRIGEVSHLMVQAGLIVLVSVISPFREERRRARELNGPAEFFEIFVDAPLEVAEARDPKGLYRKARAGLISDFTGIGSPYETPEQPELRVDTVGTTPEEAADLIIDMLERAKIFVR